MARIQVSYSQFYQMCETLKTHREEVVKTCRSLTETGIFLSNKLGFPMANAAVKNALNTAAITLEKKRVQDKQASKFNNTRILMGSLIKLYKKLGEEVPTDLLTAWQNTCRGGGQEAVPIPAESNGQAMPVRTVPDPKTISVVNRK